MKQEHTYQLDTTFHFESGESIDQLEIRYTTIGEYSPNVNVIWVCHALTANADVADWWEGLFGNGSYFDQQEYFVVCANIIGSCYGTTGPLSLNPSGERYFLNFPKVTTRDMAQAHLLLKNKLGIEQIDVLIGSSLGGQQAMEFAYLLQDRLKKLVLIATNAYHSPFGIAFNESQRLALLADPSFLECSEHGGETGLKAARSIAMLSYRSYEGYNLTQQEDTSEKTDDFKASSYQRYQGQKLVNRFNAYSYWYLSKAMDAHNMGRKRTSVEWALNQLKAETLCIGISSDMLFPVSEQAYLATHIPTATLKIMDSKFGHDGFLVDTKVLETILDEFLNSNDKVENQHNKIENEK